MILNPKIFGMGHRGLFYPEFLPFLSPWLPKSDNIVIVVVSIAIWDILCIRGNI